MASAALTVSPTLTPIFEHDALAAIRCVSLNQSGVITHG